MTENTEMSIRDAFIALDQMDDEDIVTSKPVRRVNEGKAFNVRSTTEMEKAEEVLNKPKKEVALEVIDTDADAIEHLKNNEEYVGQIILQCNSCKATRFLNPEDLVEDEADSDVYNVDDECPHCHATGNGYHILGQVGAREEESEVSLDNDSLTDEVKFDNDLEEPTEEEPTEEEPEEKEETQEVETEEEATEEDDTDLDSELTRIESEEDEEKKNESLEEGDEDDVSTEEESEEESEEEESPITVKEFVESKFVDPETLTDVVVIDLDTDSEKPIFTGEYVEIPQKVLNSEIVGFNVADGKLNIRASKDESEDTPKLDCLQYVINDMFNDDENDQISIVDAESDDEIVSGTKSDIMDKIEGYTIDLFDSPERLVITIRSSEEEPDYLSTVDEVEPEISDEDQESELIEKLIEANDMSYYKVNKYGTDEYWLAESIKTREDLDIIFEKYVTDKSFKLIKEFKEVTGYKTKLDEALEDELVESDNCISETDALSKAQAALKNNSELKAVIYGFTNGGKFNCLEGGDIMEIETDRELNMANELIDRKYHPSGTVRVLYRRNVKEGLNNTQVKNFKNRKELSEAIKACQNNNQPYTVKRSLKEGYRYTLTTINESLYDIVKDAAEEIKSKKESLNESPLFGNNSPFDDDDDDGFAYEPKSSGDVDAGSELSTDVEPEVTSTDIFDPRDRELVDKLMRIATDTKEAIESTYNVQADERFILADLIQDLRLVSGDLKPEEIERTPLNQLTLQMYDAYEGFYNELDELASALTGRQVRTSRVDKITDAVNALDGPMFTTEAIYERIQSPEFEQVLETGRVPGVQLPAGNRNQLRLEAPVEHVDYDEDDDDLDESLNEKFIVRANKDVNLVKEFENKDEAIKFAKANIDKETKVWEVNQIFDFTNINEAVDFGFLKHAKSDQLNGLGLKLHQDLNKKFKVGVVTGYQEDKEPGQILIYFEKNLNKDDVKKEIERLLGEYDYKADTFDFVEGSKDFVAYKLGKISVTEKEQIEG